MNDTERIAIAVRRGQLKLEQVTEKRRAAVTAWLEANPATEELVKDNTDAICELAELAAEDEAVSEDNTSAILELAQVILETQEELENAIVDLAAVIDELENGQDEEVDING